MSFGKSSPIASRISVEDFPTSPLAFANPSVSGIVSRSQTIISCANYLLSMFKFQLIVNVSSSKHGSLISGVNDQYPPHPYGCVPFGDVRVFLIDHPNSFINRR